MMIAIFKKSQTGAAAAISIFILLVVIAGMLTTALYSSSSSISNSVQQQDHQKALFLAESGLQVAQFEMDQASDCTDVNTGTTTYGSGTFEVVSSVDATGGCTIEVIGVSNGVVSNFSRSILFASAGGGATGFLEEFDSAADFSTNWTGKITSKPGLVTVDWDLANNAGSAGGSMLINAVAINKKPKKVTGKIERLLTNPVDATAGDITVTSSFGIMSSDDTASGSFIEDQNVEFWLTSSGGGGGDLLLWESVETGAIDNLGTWSTQPSPAATIVVGGGNVYDTIRVEFIMIAPAKNEASYIFIDDIDLSW